MARKKKTSSAELAQLQAQLEGLQRQRRSGLSTPLYTPKTLITKRGIPRKFLDNWHAREGFKADEFLLDADAQRGGERNRLYSARDGMLLSGVLDFSTIGAPLPVAKRAARLVVDCVLEMPVVASVGRPQVVVFKREGEWWIVPMLGTDLAAEQPERKVRAHVFSKDGEWREEKIGERLTDAPPLRMVFDVAEFSSRVLSDLGLSIVFGNASDMRRAASELEKA